MNNYSEFVRVSMELRKEKANYAEKLKHILHVENNAEVVGIALDLMNTVVDSIYTGGDLLVRKKDGEMIKINIPGINYAVA